MNDFLFCIGESLLSSDEVVLSVCEIVLSLGVIGMLLSNDSLHVLKNGKESDGIRDCVGIESRNGRSDVRHGGLVTRSGKAGDDERAAIYDFA